MNDLEYFAYLIPRLNKNLLVKKFYAALLFTQSPLIENSIETSIQIPYIKQSHLLFHLRFFNTFFKFFNYLSSFISIIIIFHSNRCEQIGIRIIIKLGNVNKTNQST